MKFTKMHGIGNDYVFVDLWQEKVSDPAGLARKVSKRHFSVGSDGLILMGPSGTADALMRIFNADGSEAQMCGNGVRCVAKYLWDHGRCRRNPLSIETGDGIKTLELFFRSGEVSSVKVDMGAPRLRRSEIPMTGPDAESVIDENITACGRTFSAACLSMGNPHCVIPLADFTGLDIAATGAAVENHILFPERTNVHFTKVLSNSEVTVKTWERGSGATMACGTGASAVCVAMHLRGYTGRKIITHLPGGDLNIEWSEDTGRVYMTGPAVEVFSGELAEW